MVFRLRDLEGGALPVSKVRMRIVGESITLTDVDTEYSVILQTIKSIDITDMGDILIEADDIKFRLELLHPLEDIWRPM